MTRALVSTTLALVLAVLPVSGVLCVSVCDSAATVHARDVSHDGVAQAGGRTAHHPARLGQASDGAPARTVPSPDDDASSLEVAPGVDDRAVATGGDAHAHADDARVASANHPSHHSPRAATSRVASGTSQAATSAAPASARTLQASSSEPPAASCHPDVRGTGPERRWHASHATPCLVLFDAAALRSATRAGRDDGLALALAPPMLAPGIAAHAVAVILSSSSLPSSPPGGPHAHARATAHRVLRL
jgi:hypothetical protein